MMGFLDVFNWRDVANFKLFQAGGRGSSMPQGKGFRREERDERPAPGCTASVSGSCAESPALNDFPNDGHDPQMGDGQVNGPTLGF